MRKQLLTWERSSRVAPGGRLRTEGRSRVRRREACLILTLSTRPPESSNGRSSARASLSALNGGRVHQPWLQTVVQKLKSGPTCIESFKGSLQGSRAVFHLSDTAGSLFAAWALLPSVSSCSGPA